jgi:hypothetical protein
MACSRSVNAFAPGEGAAGIVPDDYTAAMLRPGVRVVLDALYEFAHTQRKSACNVGSRQRA